MRVPAVRFGILSLIGTVIYATVLSSLGYALGSEWTKVSHGLSIVGYALFAIVVIAIVGFVLYRLRQFRRESQAPRRVPGAPESPGSGVPRRPGPGARVPAPRVAPRSAPRVPAPRVPRHGPSRTRTGPTRTTGQTPRSASS